MGSMVFQHYNLFRNKTVLQNVTESLCRPQEYHTKKFLSRILNLVEYEI